MEKISDFLLSLYREVTVYRLIASNTIEEAMLQCAQNKLRLERDMAAMDNGKCCGQKCVLIYQASLQANSKDWL